MISTVSSIAEHKKAEKRTLFVTFIAVAVFICVRIFHESLYAVYDPRNHLAIHILLEFFSIAIAFSIAIHGWMVFPHSLSKHRLFTSASFMIVGLFDLLHTLSYKGMPFFITESSVQKATWFWIVARISEAIALLAIFSQKDQIIDGAKRKKVFSLAFVYVMMVAFVIINWTEFFPLLVIEGQGVTLLKKSLEYFVILCHLGTIGVILHQYRRDKQHAMLVIVSAFVFLLMGELAFTNYHSVYDFYNVLGHLYKAIGFFFLMKGIYCATVEEPYIRRQEAEALIRHLAYHDSLTDLPNRLLFHERLETALAKARENGAMVAVMFLDLDRLKTVNDSLGYKFGDRILQVFARRLQTLCFIDTVARFEGDEFAVFITGLTEDKQVIDLVMEVLDKVSQPFLVEGFEMNVTCSIGVSLFPNDGDDGSTLLKYADIAVNQAKQGGRNQYQFYHHSMNSEVLEKLTLENELRKVLARQELIVYYQPQVDIKTGRIIGMEALLRWHHHEMGFISPGKFIPIAEETGLIVPIGEWVLRTACAQNKRWQDKGFPKVSIAVNLSVCQFRQRNLVEMVTAILEETGLEPQYLELEITESVAMHDEERLIITLQKLKDIGVTISMDDFGTGYSSLSYLKRLPIDTLKIDQSFVRDAAKKRENAVITTSIIVLAKTLELKVIAEGVENEEQLAFLTEQQCDAAQGYLFSPPVPAESVEQLLKKQMYSYTV